MLLRFCCLFLSLLWLSSAGCEREPLPELVPFVFVIPATITPGADTVARGDTLWLSMDFSDSLLDLRSNRRYRLKKEALELKASIGLHKLLGPDQYPGSFARGFTVVSKVGRILSSGATFLRFEPEYDGQRYRARIGIIPQFAGIYTIGILSVIEVPLSMPFLPVPPGPGGETRRALLEDLYYVINDGNTHFALQQQYSRLTSTLPQAAESAIYYEQKSTFAFVVR